MVKSAPPSINIARLTYLLICEAAGVAIALSTQGEMYEVSLTTGVLGGLGVALFFIWVESLMRGFTLRGFSTATLGLSVGLLCAWLLTRVQISNLLELAFRQELAVKENAADFVNAMKLALDVGLFASLGFLGVVLALRGSRDDFAFIIPYVRFRQDVSSGQPIVLDTSAVIDGRVVEIVKSGFLCGRLIIPRFVLDELQLMADQAESKAGGQRGLANLERMRAEAGIQLTIHDSDPNADSTNARLMETTRLLNARLMTLDDNLTKVAKLQAVQVLNLHELDEALKSAVVVGQRVRVPLVRNGKEEGQAVGYLPDGTMLVVNHAAAKIGSTVEAVVTSTLQTGSGMMAFGELFSVKP